MTLVRWGIGGAILSSLLAMGCGMTITEAPVPPHKPERQVEASCRAVPLPGVEDVTTDPEGRLYISSADRGRIFHPFPDREHATPAGKLYRLDLAGGAGLEPLSPTDENFYPHGLDLLPGGSRADRLFVINHPLQRDQSSERWDRCQPKSWIERYDVVDRTLHPAEPRRLAYDSEALTNYNDVAAAGPDTFYATRDSAALTCNGRIADLVFGRRTGAVLAYHAGQWRVVADGIGFANGIALDTKRSRLYVAAMQEGALRVYHWNSANPLLPLVLDTIVPLGTGLDNITMQDEDTLLVAAHPSLLSFARYWFDRDWRPHAQVLRLALPKEPRNGAWVYDPLSRPPEVILEDDGRHLSAVSVALVPPGFPGSLLVGNVFGSEFHILDAERSATLENTRLKPRCPSS